MNSSLKTWEFYNPVKIFAGRGSRSKLPTMFKQNKLLIVTTLRGRLQFTSDPLLFELSKDNEITWIDSIKENPGLSDLQIEIDHLQNTSFDAIIAFGGGSSIDAAKTIRVGLADNCACVTLAELIEKPKLYELAQLLPLYALPTTAGTGSEVTPFATVWHHELRKKLSLAGSQIFPTVAIVDAKLIDEMPISITISTGMDTINQAAESIWNRNANSITIAYASRSLQLSLKALPILAAGKGGKIEREQMAEASLLAGIAISHTRTALCHSISYPLTAHFGVPHGLACAFTMPAVCKSNLSADDGRFKALAELLTGIPESQGLYNIFEDLNEKLNIREIVKNYIPCLEDLFMLKNEMYDPSRAVNNLVKFDVDELCKILNESWG